MKEIILLTSEFPYVIGDGNFIINEIQDLAIAFDKVYIARKNKLKGIEEFELPPNVELVFEGFTGRKQIISKGFFNLSKLPLKLFFQDFKELTSFKFWMRFFMSFLLGRAVYSDPIFKEVLKKKGITIYSFWGTGMAFLVPFLNRVTSNLVIKLHGGDLYAYRTGYIPFRKCIYSKAKAIITISQDGKDYVTDFLRNFNISKEKLELVRMGTKVPEKALLVKESTEKLVVSCSSLIPLKRVALIYDLLLATSDKIKIKWVHFGGGPLFEDLKKRLMQTDNLIVDLKGTQTNDTIVDFYSENKIDLFINCSTTEGIPVSIMEAISFDVPVLATDAGGTSEIVGENHGTGELIPVDFDLQVVTSTVFGILTDSSNYSPKVFWEENYNAKRNNQKLINILAL